MHKMVLDTNQLVSSLLSTQGLQRHLIPHRQVLSLPPIAFRTMTVLPVPPVSLKASPASAIDSFPAFRKPGV